MTGPSIDAVTVAAVPVALAVALAGEQVRVEPLAPARFEMALDPDLDAARRRVPTGRLRRGAHRRFFLGS